MKKYALDKIDLMYQGKSSANGAGYVKIKGMFKAVNGMLRLLTMTGLLGLSSNVLAQMEVPSWWPTWTKSGELQLPGNFQTWVFLGGALTPNALNDGKAGFPEFHNVYIQPEAYQEYQKTGQFPEGTVLLKELQLTLPGANPDGSSVEPSGRGYFPGKLNGIDISVKDSKKFKNTNGWGFFNFGHHAPPYEPTAKVQAKEACAACHMANADHMVFKRFYPKLAK